MHQPEDEDDPQASSSSTSVPPPPVPPDGNLINHPYKTVSRVSGPPLPISDCFVNLSKLRSSSSDDEEEEEEFVANSKTHHHRSLGNTYEFLRNVERFDVKLSELVGISSPKALVFGPAGMGKTTFCCKLLHEFVQNKTRFPFKYVMFISLRSLKREVFKNGWSLSSFIEYTYFPHDTPKDRKEKGKRAFDFYMKNRNDFCIILDGLDEVKNILNDSSGSANFLQDLLSPQDIACIQPGFLIVTGRPYGVPEKVRGSFTLFQVEGFDSKDVEKYIHLVFSPHRAKIAQVSKFIAESPTVSLLVRAPILLDILCVCFGHLIKKKGVGITSLFENILQSMLASYKETSLEDTPSAQILDSCVPDIEYLKNLAYFGLKNDMLEFDAHELPRVPEGFEKDLQFLPRLRQSKILHSDIESGVGLFSFLHLTFQDFYAAQYLKEHMEEEEVRELIRDNKYEPRFQLVWQFLAGLLSKEEDKLKLHRFFDILELPPRDFLPVAHGILLSGCLRECEQASLGSERRDRLSKEVVEWGWFLCERGGSSIVEDVMLPTTCVEMIFEELDSLRPHRRVEDVVERSIRLEKVLCTQSFLLPSVTLRLLNMEEMKVDYRTFEDESRQLLIFSPHCVLSNQKSLSLEFFHSFNRKWRGADRPLMLNLISCLTHQRSVPQGTVKVIADAAHLFDNALVRHLKGCLGALQILSNDTLDMIEARLRALTLDEGSYNQFNILAAFLQGQEDLYQSRPGLLSTLAQGLTYGLDSGPSCPLATLCSQPKLPQGLLDTLFEMVENHRVAEVAVKAIGSARNLSEEVLRRLFLLLTTTNESIATSIKGSIIDAFVHQKPTLPSYIVDAIIDLHAHAELEPHCTNLSLVNQLPPSSVSKLMNLLEGGCADKGRSFVLSLLSFNPPRFKELEDASSLDRVVQALVTIVNGNNEELKDEAIQALTTHLTPKDFDLLIRLDNEHFSNADISRIEEERERPCTLSTMTRALTEDEVVGKSFVGVVKSFCQQLKNDETVNEAEYVKLMTRACKRTESLIINGYHFRIPSIEWRLDLGAVMGDRIEGMLCQAQASILNFPFPVNVIDLKLTFTQERHQALDSATSNSNFKEVCKSPETRILTARNLKHNCTCRVSRHDPHDYLRVESEYSGHQFSCRCTLHSMDILVLRSKISINLRHLDVRGNRFEDTEAKEFLPIFETCKNLWSLTLCHNRIGKEGMITLLADMEKAGSRLKHLGLTNNRIFLGKEDTPLFNSMVSNTALESIDLHMNFVNKEFLKEVTKGPLVKSYPPSSHSLLNCSCVFAPELRIKEIYSSPSNPIVGFVSLFQNVGGFANFFQNVGAYHTCLLFDIINMTTGQRELKIAELTTRQQTLNIRGTIHIRYQTPETIKEFDDLLEKVEPSRVGRRGAAITESQYKAMDTLILKYEREEQLGTYFTFPLQFSFFAWVGVWNCVTFCIRILREAGIEISDPFINM